MIPRSARQCVTKSSRFFRPESLHAAPMMLARMSSSAATATSAPPAPSSQIVERIHDFDKRQANRPDFDKSNAPIQVTKHPHPDWKYGDGVPGSTAKNHIEVDPYAADRPAINNYRLLISGIAPRPIGFISTVSGDGTTKNLAPFSYFQVIDHDPPMFVVGFSARAGRSKDTYRNLKESGECVINTVSETMIEAVNATSLDAPYGVSEWVVSGLHEAPSTTVRPSRVRESVLSVEGKVVDIKEFSDHSDGGEGRSVAGMALIKASRFWVQEDATNTDVSHIELEKLRPIAQLGGISYGRVSSTFELPRKTWAEEAPKSELLSRLDGKKD